MPSALGAEPKKVLFLGFLIVLIGGIYVYNREPEVTVVVPRQVAPAISTPTVIRSAPRTGQAKQKGRGGTEDFHPTLKLPDDFDLSKVDPTLRTDLLAKVRAVGDAGGSRSLFEFYTPPPPPPPKVEPIKPIDFASNASKQPEPPKPTGPVEPPKPPPPPPIPLKYYGYVGQPRAGKLQALFIDGEETFYKGAGDTIRNRYRIVRIGTTSAEVEDTVAKNTQTLRILERCEDSPSCK
jgi:hypothetical protein